jgi:hypothetical protein
LSIVSVLCAKSSLSCFIMCTKICILTNVSISET